MPYPLTLATMLQRNRLLFGKKEVVGRDFSGIHRYTYAEYNVRVAKLANALKRLGVRPGERVATFGWNSHRHLEAYFAVPCMGAVLHTLNIRLFEDQFTFIVNHAEDAVMLVDEDLLPVVEAVGGQVSDRPRLCGHERQEDRPAHEAFPGLLVRGVAGRRDGGARLAFAARRKLDGGPLLHDRHHGKTEGGSVLPQGDLPARPCDLRGRYSGDP